MLRQESLERPRGEVESTLKLGPSRDFLDKVKLLEKIEKSVLTEEVELRRRGGVYEVDVTFNKKETVPMIFDTGEALSPFPRNLPGGSA